jgi:hypothetical protein
MSLSDYAAVTLAQAKAHLRLAHASTLHVGAEYVGMGDGETLVFTLDHAPIEGSIAVYVDSTLKTYTTHYSVSGTTLTFTSAGKPALNKAITAAYDYAATTDTFEDMDDLLLERLIEAATFDAEGYCGKAFVQRAFTEEHNGDGGEILRLRRMPVVSVSAVVYKLVDTDDGDGATLAFTLSGTPKTGTLVVVVDGVTKTETTHYTESGGVVTFTSAPTDGAHIEFRYDVALYVGDDYTERLHVGRLHGDWVANYRYSVTYTAGLAASRAALQTAYPEISQAVLLQAAYLYEHRIDLVDSEDDGLFRRTFRLPSSAMALLARHRWDII